MSQRSEAELLRHPRLAVMPTRRAALALDDSATDVNHAKQDTLLQCQSVCEGPSP